MNRVFERENIANIPKAVRLKQRIFKNNKRLCVKACKTGYKGDCHLEQSLRTGLTSYEGRGFNDIRVKKASIRLGKHPPLSQF